MTHYHLRYFVYTFPTIVLRFSLVGEGGEEKGNLFWVFVVRIVYHIVCSTMTYYFNTQYKKY